MFVYFVIWFRAAVGMKYTIIMWLGHLTDFQVKWDYYNTNLICGFRFIIEYLLIYEGD